ncbi:MAG: hypothetical protein LC634_10370 [Sphingomonadales bacterium]|nr:hypothetical protein [Sphingomonadales bacterium]
MRVVTPLADPVVGANHVAQVEVTIGDTAEEALVVFDEKAAEKRAERGLAPVEGELAERPSREEYATLPLDVMLPLMIEDHTREWGLTSGRALRLDVTIDTLKTANAAMAWLAGSSDQLAGMVEVSDATTGEPLGEFYVDVINSHSGLLGMAIRGAGIREELAEEFGIHVARQLSGREDRN